METRNAGKSEIINRKSPVSKAPGMCIFSTSLKHPSNAIYTVYNGKFFKDWCRSMWHKKKIYWAVVPHVFDQATDLGTIMVYYDAWK